MSIYSVTCVDTMGSVITVQPSISMYLLHVKNISVHFKWKNVKKRPILYEKLFMKVYLNGEKTHEGYWALHDILWGLKNHCFLRKTQNLKKNLPHGLYTY